MGDEALITLAAVALGWFLNELAGAFRIAREERQLSKGALPVLLHLYFEQFRINEILSFFNAKMGDDMESFHKAIESGAAHKESVGDFLAGYLAEHEEMWRTSVSLPEESRSSLIESAKQTTSSLAKVDPVSAYSARKLLSEFILFQKSELPKPDQDPQVYVNHLAMMLTVYRRDLSSLKKLILRVAWRSGIVEYFRIRKQLRDEEAEISGGMAKAWAHSQKPA